MGANGRDGWSRLCKCARIQTLLDDAPGDESDDELREHLDRCRRCRREIAAALSVRRILAEIAQAEPVASSVPSSLRRRIERDLRFADGQKGGNSTFAGPLGLALLATAAALLATLVLAVRP